MQGLRDLTHEKEAEVSLITAKPELQPGDWLLLNGVIASIRSKLEESLLELRPLLGETLNLGIKSYHHPEPTLMKLLHQARASGIQTTLVENWERTLLHEPVVHGFSHFNEIISQAAEILGKKISPIAFEGGELKVYLKAYEGLFSSLVHAFRNAVDHGIEPPEKRLAAGKTEAGEIRVIFQTPQSPPENPQLKIQIKDDGGGINAGKIRELLKGRNPAHPLMKAEDSDVYQALFESGLSTSAEVTNLSGRGVGLDAILYEAQCLKGSARLDSQLGRGTTLTIQVPLLSALYLDSPQA
jgi:two-component system chemotaxis sensor kinase CheA